MRRRTRRRAFSIIEMLVALAITATLLTASLSALDASFKSYKVTTDSASTHVVLRIVMQRLSAMIRTGREFGPYPVDVLDPDENPVVSSTLEFVSADDPETGYRQITRLELRDDEESPDQQVLYLIIEDIEGDVVTVNEQPLLRGVEGLVFTLRYDVGPRLTRATVDITVRPNDLRDGGIGGDIEAPTIRMVTSTSPRLTD